jgi:hypothetical protein
VKGRSAYLLALAVACIALAACSEDERKRTQIVVVVSSDLSIPAELDEVRVEAVAARDGATPTDPASGALGDDGLALPVSVALEPSGDGLGPIEVTVTGHHDGALVLSQVRELSFARGKSVVLRMHLSRACTGATAPGCDDDETCSDGECEGRFVAVDDLPAYTGPDSIGTGSGGAGGGAGADGGVDRDAAVGDGGTATDGGVAGTPGDGGSAGASGSGGGGSGVGGAGAGTGGTGDAGMGEPCEPSAEICNDDDEDCDGFIDEDFDFTSLAHCGSCDNACPTSPSFAISVCASGTCQLLCAPGTAHCDEDVENGCEARLSDVETCGDCDTTCEGSEPFCAQDGSSSMCVGSCTGTTPDECGESCTNTESDIFHCNECDNECDEVPNATPVCEAGSCDFDCLGEFQDCDGMDANGCETDTLSDVDSCGGCEPDDVCPTRAHSSRSCVEGECRIACAPGWGNCNTTTTDGCETDTTDNDDHCGACNVACTGSQVCCGTRCGIVNLLGICL